MKKQWTGHIAAQMARLKPCKKIFLVFTWIEPNRRRDPDNIAAGGRKLILDAMVVAGVIQDDSWKYVRGWKDKFFTDKQKPGVVVKIISL